MTATALPVPVRYWSVLLQKMLFPPAPWTKTTSRGAFPAMKSSTAPTPPR